MGQQLIPSASSRRKCANCGLVNAAADEVCRRCGASLSGDDETVAREAVPVSFAATDRPKRSFLRRVAWVCSATTIALIIAYASLLLTSNGLQADQRAKVQAAIAQLQQHGFDREAFVLKDLTVFRSSDNWWNRYLGHRDAYAATNFPFEVVTLYPEFFEVIVDDRERAAVLLHEGRHLLGDGEEEALQSSWKRKAALGWTADRYKQTRVWAATERLTKAQFPYMFQCGSDGQSDCY